MKTGSVSGNEITLTLSAHEARIVNNALLETLEALAGNADEFSTRVGASIEEVKALLGEVNAAVRQLS